MVIEILNADRRSTVGVGIVAPGNNTCIRNIGREEVTEPVDIVHHPCLFTVSIEPVDGDSTIIPS